MNPRNPAANLHLFLCAGPCERFRRPPAAIAFSALAVRIDLSSSRSISSGDIFVTAFGQGYEGANNRLPE